MSFAAFIERHARTIVVLAVALAVAGAVAAVSLPVGLFPQVSFPRVVVDLDAGSRPADQTALLVTRPVEQAIRTVPGVRDVRSETTRGSAQISVDFGWGRDMVASTLLVDAAIAQVLPGLPPGTAYNVRRMDPTVYPIISYALLPPEGKPAAALSPSWPGVSRLSAPPRRSSDGRNTIGHDDGKTAHPDARADTSGQDGAAAVAIRDLAEYQIVPLLSSIPGLARVNVQGGETAEVEVMADPHRLATYGLGLTELVNAVSAGNVLQAVGRVQDRDKLYLVVADHSVAKTDEVGAIIVRSDPSGIVRVRDVATVRNGVVPQWLRVVEDGRPAVLFNVYEQPDGNAVQIAAAVRDRLAAFHLPPGVRLVKWYDQSELVTQSAASVRDAVLIGLVLAAGVLMLFLRSWRVTLIAVLTVPATLATAVLLLSLLGMSFNIMTLGGIAAAVGLLIDDVIVMVEHIARRAGTPGEDGTVPGQVAVLAAGREFMPPLSGSTLATLIVFLPLGFLSGVTGAFSKALSITMAAALAMSYLMTAFVVPVLARRIVDFDRWRDPGAAGDDWLSRQHGRLLDWLFRRPWILGIAVVPLLVLGWFAYHAVPTGFMPSVDEGGFVMDYYTKPGTSLIETQREIAQVDAMLLANPQVATFSRRLGTGLGGDLGQSYHGDYFVRLKPNHTESTPAVMAHVLAQVQALVPGVDVELAQLMEDLIGDLTAVPQPIEIKLFGSDYAALIPQARKIAAAIGKVDGVVEVKSGVQLAGDALDIRIDPVRAGMEGVTPDDVTRAVDTALSGTIATWMPETVKAVGVRVRLPDAFALRQAGLADLPVRAPDGHVFPLHRVATLVPLTGQPQISRENLQPMIAVTGRIEGRGIGAAVADVRRVVDQPGMLAPGIRYELGGLYRQQQIAFAGLTRVFAAALVAEFLLLLFLYERFWLPVIIIGCSLLSTTAVFTGLWVSGVELNITALMGMTMIIGIATEMAIFYVSEYAELSHGMEPRQALREASRNRLRPITMTTLAAILTLLPLAFAIGQGSGIQQPLAIAIIAGLLLQFPLVLLAMPVLIGLTLPGQGGAVAGADPGGHA
ncbi:efflux RND transporter permease subunit [Rhodopila globiformis]|uniref:Transporter n=1 Tax=Rhodopila globiformis TaxID=1071 RepID=A0A2S6N7A2_RHOGL|nr:efflux RND transporter permease subunit [Rhodopila globiformis]PPQ30477.1 transporter [Rhodopila globiformis]